MASIINVLVIFEPSRCTVAPRRLCAACSVDKFGTFHDHQLLICLTFVVAPFKHEPRSSRQTICFSQQDSILWRSAHPRCHVAPVFDATLNLIFSTRTSAAPPANADVLRSSCGLSADLSSTKLCEDFATDQLANYPTFRSMPCRMCNREACVPYSGGRGRG